MGHFICKFCNVDYSLQTIFSVETKEPVVQPKTWYHVCATYGSITRKAEIYINGELKNSQTSLGGGTLSQVRYLMQVIILNVIYKNPSLDFRP